MAQKSIECRSNIFKTLEDVVLIFQIDKLTIKHQKNQQTIIINDNNLGGSSIESPNTTTNGINYLSILYFKESATDGGILKKKHLFDVFCQTDNQVQEIANLINLVALPTQKKAEKSIDDVVESISRNILVIINPFSGTGRGEKIYTDIAPYLKYFNSKHSKLVSDSKEQLIEFGKKILKSDYDLIIVIGGDGTLHYIINGMYQDLQPGDQVVEKPFVMVPTGSGNALIGSIMVHSKLSYDLDNCVYLCFKGGSVALTLSQVNVQYQNNLGRAENKQLLSFLNLSWGAIADIDIESYKYKLLGEQRYAVSGIKNILFRKKRMAKIYYKPYGKGIESAEVSESNLSILDGPEGGCYLSIVLSQMRNITSAVTISEDIFIGFPGYAMLVMRGHASSLNLFKLVTSDNFYAVCQSVKSNKPLEKPVWLEIINIEGFNIETDGGRLVIDGELICEGKFTCELNILPYKLQHLAII